jgi:hypothetical protein
LGYANEPLSALEQQTAIEAALANSTHGYLTQVRIVEVERTNGPPVSIEAINRNLRGKKGRRAEYLDLAPDGNFTLVENKFAGTIYNSYSKRGGQFPLGSWASSAASCAERTTSSITHGARLDRGVVVSGLTLDGRKVRLRLDPQKFRGSTVSPYLIVGDN